MSAFCIFSAVTKFSSLPAISSKQLLCSSLCALTNEGGTGFPRFLSHLTAVSTLSRSPINAASDAALV